MFEGLSSSAFSPQAECITFDANDTIQGGPNSATFKYIEIELTPCNETSTTCKSNGLSPGVDLSNSKAQAIFKYLRNVVLEMSFVEAGAKVSDYANPLKLHINSHYRFRVDMFQEKYTDFYFIPFTIETVYGILFDQTSTDSSIALNNALFESTTRDPGTSSFTKKGKNESSAANYLNIRFLAENKQLNVIRTYSKIIDVFSNIGGIA